MKNEWTGERMETFVFGQTTVEHLHRYALASEYVNSKKVLDIACGEGYGSNLLAQNAASVIGVDIDEAAVTKAASKYKRSNIQFKTGNILAIPCDDKSIDIIVCFETIEHTEDHQKLIREIKRVLAPGGLLIISTPDKKIYTDEKNNTNPFHLKELSKEEFQNLLESGFTKSAILYQQSLSGSLIYSEKTNTNINSYQGDFTSCKKNKTPGHTFLIAFASDYELPVLSASIFLANDIMNLALSRQLADLQSTFTYRTGSLILYPFKKIWGLWKKIVTSNRKIK